MVFFLGFINVIVALAAILLIFLVVVQSNRGSDLGLFGGSAEMVFGSQQLNALSKITVILAIVVMGGVFLSGAIKVFSSKNNGNLSESSKQGTVLTDIKKPSINQGVVASPTSSMSKSTSSLGVAKTQEISKKENVKSDDKKDKEKKSESKKDKDKKSDDKKEKKKDKDKKDKESK